MARLSLKAPTSASAWSRCTRLRSRRAPPPRCTPRSWDGAIPMCPRVRTTAASLPKVATRLACSCATACWGPAGLAVVAGNSRFWGVGTELSSRELERWRCNLQEMAQLAREAGGPFLTGTSCAARSVPYPCLRIPVPMAGRAKSATSRWPLPYASAASRQRTTAELFGNPMMRDANSGDVAPIAQWLQVRQLRALYHLVVPLMDRRIRSSAGNGETRLRQGELPAPGAVRGCAAATSKPRLLRLCVRVARGPTPPKACAVTEKNRRDVAGVSRRGELFVIFYAPPVAHGLSTGTRMAHSITCARRSSVFSSNAEQRLRTRAHTRSTMMPQHIHFRARR
eukprot:scaffold706_cov418-Prasinococcus_capsulatus_cf.AAC.17